MSITLCFANLNPTKEILFNILCASILYNFLTLLPIMSNIKKALWFYHSNKIMIASVGRILQHGDCLLTLEIRKFDLQ